MTPVLQGQGAGPERAEPEGTLSGRMGGRPWFPPPPPRVGLHASLGAEPAFLRKAKLPKQINQSVKNLSPLSAKKLKGGIVPGDEEGNSRHLQELLARRAPSMLPAPSHHVSPLGPCVGQPRAITTSRHQLLGRATPKAACPGRWGPHPSVVSETQSLSAQWRPKDLSRRPHKQ